MMTPQQKMLDELRNASTRAVARAMDFCLDDGAALEVRQCELAIDLHDDRIREMHYLLDQLESEASLRRKK